MKLTVVATSDLHLGMTFSAYPEVRQSLIEARYESLDRVVEAANGGGADLIIVAGDLFDRPRVASETVLRAVASLSRFEGTLVAVLPGNHDYTAGLDSSPWDAFSRATADAKVAAIVLDEARPYDLREYGLPAVLLAGPCTSKHRDTHTIGWTASGIEAPEDTFLIGVAHGSIEGISPDMEGRYYPMRLSDFERASAQAWIVGHTHLHIDQAIRGGRRLYVPGTPEPDGFDCRNPGEIFVIEFDAEAGVTAQSVETGRYRFYDRSGEVRSFEDIQTLFALPAGTDPERSLLRITLRGTLPEDEYARYASWRTESADELCYFRAEDAELHEEMSRAAVEERYPVDSFPHRLLSSLLEDDDAEAVQLAFQYLEHARPQTDKAGS